MKRRAQAQYYGNWRVGHVCSMGLELEGLDRRQERLANDFLLREIVTCASPVTPGEQAKAAGFLAARVLPVDGYRIRNSLFLSVRMGYFCVCNASDPSLAFALLQQLLRTPAAAAINVVENEDAARVLAEAPCLPVDVGVAVVYSH